MKNQKHNIYLLNGELFNIVGEKDWLSWTTAWGNIYSFKKHGYFQSISYGPITCGHTEFYATKLFFEHAAALRNA